MSTLGWSVSEKEAEWKLASDVTCRGEKLMLRTATVRGWQPQAGALSRACLATLLRVRMMGMLASEEKEENEKKVFFYKNQTTGKLQTKQKSFCFLFSVRIVQACGVKYPSVNHNEMPEPEWRSAPQRISEKKSAENTHACAIVLKKSGL